MSMRALFLFALTCVTANAEVCPFGKYPAVIKTKGSCVISAAKVTAVNPIAIAGGGVQCNVLCSATTVAKTSATCLGGQAPSNDTCSSASKSYSVMAPLPSVVPVAAAINTPTPSGLPAPRAAVPAPAPAPAPNPAQACNTIVNVGDDCTSQISGTTTSYYGLCCGSEADPAQKCIQNNCMKNGRLDETTLSSNWHYRCTFSAEVWTRIYENMSCMDACADAAGACGDLAGSANIDNYGSFPTETPATPFIPPSLHQTPYPTPSGLP